jgi:hypothetical protein
VDSLSSSDRCLCLHASLPKPAGQKKLDGICQSKIYMGAVYSCTRSLCIHKPYLIIHVPDESLSRSNPAVVTVIQISAIFKPSNSIANSHLYAMRVVLQFKRSPATTASRRSTPIIHNISLNNPLLVITRLTLSPSLNPLHHLPFLSIFVSTFQTLPLSFDFTDAVAALTADGFGEFY